MIVLRAVESRDAMPLARLSQVMEERVISLPRYPLELEKLMSNSIEAFTKKQTDGSEIYLFVLEDIERQELIGTSQIIAKTLGSTLGYYYRQESYIQAASRLQESLSIPFLRPIRHTGESSELGGLFLHPSARQKGLSKLLSLGRLLFIASYPERFQKELIAEMLGYTDDNDNSVFWNAIGHHFLNINFDELVRQVALDPSFIPGILPSFPIYLSMLPQEVQQLVGKTHPQSEVALQRLLDEGFHYTGEIDIFDGGPKISAEVSALHCFSARKTARAVCCPLPPDHQELVLLSNHHLNFRACMTMLCVQSPETVWIEPKAAELLRVSTGELVHYLPIHKHALQESV